MSSSRAGPPTELATFLRAHRADILAAWEHAARAIPRAVTVSKPQLMDFVPQLLDRIATLVAQAGTGEARGLPAEVAAKHALDRLEEGFDLTDVVAELSLLRSTVLRMWQEARSTHRGDIEGERALSEVVDQATIASVARFTEARDRALRALDRVSSAALEAPSLDELLQQLLAAFHEEMPVVDTVAILLREGDELVLRAAHGLEEDLESLRMKIGEGFAGRVAAERRPLALASAATDPQIVSEVIRSKGVQALYGVPLIAEDEVLGVAHMGSLCATEFSKQDRVLFGSMAARATAGIYQQLLREAQQRFEATFENAAVGMAHVGLQGTWLRLNRRFCELLGYSHEELARLRFHDVTHPDDLEQDLALSERLRTGEIDHYTLEKRYIRKDGRVVWVALTGALVRDAAGKPLYFVATAQDVSDRKHAEAEAASERALLEALMDNIPIGITIADGPDVRIRAVSRYGREVTGRPSGGLEGIGVDDHVEQWGVLRADGTPASGDELPLTRATRGEQVRTEEWLLQRPDGRRVPILCTAGPIRDAHGTVVGGVIGWQDITERKRTVALLREREERLRLVIDATGIGAFDFYPQSGRLEWSAHAKRHFGLSEDADVDYETFLRGVHPDDRERIDRIVREALRPEGGGSYMTEYRTIGIDDGRERWLTAQGRVLFDAAGNPERFVGVTLDITERKRAEQREREAAARKDEFLAMLGHELRNPLAAIRSASELLRLTSIDDARLARVSDVLERQSFQMTRLVDGLLEISRIARGKIVLQRETLDAGTVVSAIVADQQPQARARGLTLSARVRGPVWVSADPARLTQVVDNLVGNALKFTEAPGRVDVEVEAVDGKARIRVQDSGVGIPPELLDRLFEPFQQNPQDLARSSGGLGLGLAVARGLVELHGGTIGAQSQGPGSGAEFVVDLQLAEAPMQTERSGTVAPARSRRVLVVEDNTDAAEMLRNLLEFCGHEVRVASSGPDALEALHSGRIELVLCDIGLPGMDGYAVARAVREDPALRSLHLVAVTGYGQPDDRRRTAEAGFDEHLVKPVDLAALQRVLDQVGD